MTETTTELVERIASKAGLECDKFDKKVNCVARDYLGNVFIRHVRLQDLDRVREACG